LRQMLAASTPAAPAIEAETASGPPVVSKNARPSEAVNAAGVETAMLPMEGASVATQTRAARSQTAPAEQSPSFEQLPRSDVRQEKSDAERSTTKVARMAPQKAKVRTAPAASRTPETM